MKLGISIKIDVTKIDKARIHEGQKGKYIYLTTFIDTDQQDQYGNHGFISQSVSKEERAQDVKMPILGNCKVFFKKEADPNNISDQQARPADPPPQAPNYGQQQDAPIDDIPF